MKSAHTPGPWSLPHFVTADEPREKDGPEIKAFGIPRSSKPCRCGYVLSEMYCGAIATVHFNDKPDQTIEDGSGDDPTLEEAKANARLIAAAPDLLAALVGIVESPIGSSAVAMAWGKQFDAARAAIAKAAQ